MATLSLEQLTNVFPTNAGAVRAGQEKVTPGTIGLDGNVVNGVSANEQDVAMVFRNNALRLEYHQRRARAWLSSP